MYYRLPFVLYEYRANQYTVKALANTVLFLLVILLIYDAMGPRFLPWQKEMQAAFFGLTFMVSFLIYLVIFEGRVSRWILLFLCVLVIEIIPAYDRIAGFSSWILGDLLLTSAPLGFILLSRLYPGVVIGRAFSALMLILLFVAVQASFFPDYSDRGRFEAPAILLQAYLWVNFMQSKGGRKALSALGLIIVLVLAWQSQWRGSVAVFMLIPILMIASGGLFGKRAIAIILAIVLGAIAVASKDDIYKGLIENTRFETLVSKGATGDDSLMFRLTEGLDVLSEVKSNWGFLNYLFGEGHGAVFRPNYTYHVMTERYRQGNIKKGMVHNIHIGMLMIAYRYGFVGLGIYGGLLLILFTDLVGYSRRLPGEINVQALLIASICYLLLLNLYNVMNHLLFPLTIGYYLGFRHIKTL